MTEKKLQYPDAQFRQARDELYRDAFSRSTQVALQMAAEMERSAKPEHQNIASILGILEGCTVPEVITSSEQYGASYKQLAYVAHRAGLDKEERQTWYKVSASIPLSQAHAGFLISRLDMINDLEELYRLEAR